MKRFSILIAALCLCLTGCGKQTTEATAQIFAMDTVMEVAAYGEHAEQAVKYTEKRIEELENRLSRTKAHSLVSGLNRDGSIRHLTYDYWNLIARAKEYRDATNGAFDITIAPVMDAWGFTGDSFRVPEQSELDTLLKKVNSDAIQMLGSPSDSVTLGEGQAIDLGGIAKGYTSDCVEAVFYDHEIENGKISLGGNVFVLGTKPDGSDWGSRIPGMRVALRRSCPCGTPTPSPPAATSGTLRKTEKPTTILLIPPPAILRTAVCCQ